MREIKTKDSKIYYKENDNTYKEVGRIHSINYTRDMNPLSFDYPIGFEITGNLYTDKVIDELNRVIRGDNTKRGKTFFSFFLFDFLLCLFYYVK